MTPLPQILQINAWAGPRIDNTAAVDAGLSKRLLAHNQPTASTFHRPIRADLRDWHDPLVGWGLVLPDTDDTSPKTSGLWPTDPEPLAGLLVARNNAPVLRWNRSSNDGVLRRYNDNGTFQEISWNGLNYGTEPGKIPRYLLICAAPAIIPWRVQYALQSAYFVGRLDLDLAGLENYVEAVATNWATDAVDPLAQLLWSVVHNGSDITGLMRATITAPLQKKLADDGAYTPILLTGAEADTATLIARLGASKPALVVTSSHGATYPLADPQGMRAQLGYLVDQNYDLLNPAALMTDWCPDGAIWYAHACCSAGADGVSSFLRYVTAGSDVAQILQGVADCGPMTAPLPRALLGAKRPLRAFFGQVEPTFDWTLRLPDTRQFMTMPLMDLLYTGLFSEEPVGMAIGACRRASASLTASYNFALDEMAEGKEVQGVLLRMQLAAKDWDTLVILGDPAVTLAPLTRPARGFRSSRLIP